jgi:glycosyltransferase involved in cell wall biosynthesis
MVTIANGHGQFHLAFAAKAAFESGILEQFITGLYPTATVQSWLGPLTRMSRAKKLERWLMRGVPGLPDDIVRTSVASEAFYQLAAFSSRFNGRRNQNYDSIALRILTRKAARCLARSNARLYHCRAGYGGQSIQVAKQMGMTVVIDQSIAYPDAYVQLIERGGTYAGGESTKLPAVWELVKKDIADADYVLVNSDFVKQTHLDYGISEQKIRVIYWGLDESFESYLGQATLEGRRPSSIIRFLFAGEVGRRKGADILLEVIKDLPPQGWELTIAGSPDESMFDQVAHCSLRNVRFLGSVTRDQIAKLMMSHHVFVFPTLAEGSARVIFEAMGAGMATITTPNAGSAIRNGITGWVIPPGDRAALANAMTEVLMRRSTVEEYGKVAETEARSCYNSTSYKRQLVGFYKELLATDKTENLGRGFS